MKILIENLPIIYAAYSVIGVLLAVHELKISNKDEIAKAVERAKMSIATATLIILVIQLVIMAFWPVFMIRHIISFIVKKCKSIKPQGDTIHLYIDGDFPTACGVIKYEDDITSIHDNVNCPKCLEIMNTREIVIPAGELDAVEPYDSDVNYRGKEDEEPTMKESYELRHVAFYDIPKHNRTRHNYIVKSGSEDDCMFYYFENYSTGDIFAANDSAKKYREDNRLNYYYIVELDGKQYDIIVLDYG